MPKKPKEPAAVDPDKLVRQSAGTYRTADDRFEVRDAGTGWFLVDSEQTNDFGQELIQGPFPTLAAVRTAIPPARSTKVKPIRSAPSAREASPKAKGKTDRKAKARTAATPPPPPPTSWIDKLPTSEGAAVRRLIASLERDGVGDAETLVRRDREGIGPALATRLIERGLAEIVDELPERGRPGARELVRRAVELLSAGGTKPGADRPGWMLIETGPEPEPANRRIVMRELDG